MGHADGRNAEHRPEVQSQSGATGVIASCGIDEQHPGELLQRQQGLFQKRTVSQCQVSGSIASAGRSGNRDSIGDATVPHDGGPCPSGVARRAGAGPAAAKADEDAANE